MPSRVEDDYLEKGNPLSIAYSRGIRKDSPEPILEKSPRFFGSIITHMHALAGNIHLCEHSNLFSCIILVNSFATNVGSARSS